MTKLQRETIETIANLQSRGIDPLLYGSQGVSLYLGDFKQFNDIDLLVDTLWLEEDWRKLVAAMDYLGFRLVNEHEHEFEDSSKNHVAFASLQILVRDGIVKSLNNYLQEFTIGGVEIKTLRPELFKRAYEFSKKDGYRKEVRGKNDQKIIELLENYLAKEGTV